MKPSFVNVTSEHISEVLEMMSDFNSLFNYEFNSQVTRKNIEKFIDNGDLGIIWLIKDEHLTIGYIALCFGYSFEYHGRDAFIDELFIKRPYRGKGIGTFALDFVKSKASDLGVGAIHLEVEKDNLSGNKLYKKSGYEDHQRTLMTLRLNNEDS